MFNALVLLQAVDIVFKRLTQNPDKKINLDLIGTCNLYEVRIKIQVTQIDRQIDIPNITNINVNLIRNDNWIKWGGGHLLENHEQI